MIDKTVRVSDCERALLGCMILNPFIIPNIRCQLSPFAFQEERHKEIYLSLLSLDSKGAGTDFIAIVNENAAIDSIYLAELTEVAALPHSVNYYVSEINSAYILRECQLMALKIKDRVTSISSGKLNDSDSVKELLADIQRNVFNLSGNITNSVTYDMKELIVKEIDFLNECTKQNKEVLGYRTGFKELDKLMDGLQSIYMIIGARPSLGKTALAQKIAWELTQQGVKTLFIELEMSPKQLIERYLSQQANISFQKIRSGILSNEMKNDLAKSITAISQNQNLIPAECPGRMLDDIINLCRAQVRTNGVKAIFIDHIGLIRIKEHLSGFEKVREISNTLQQLQRELNVPLIALCQLSRSAENNQEPGLNEIRGSGAIEEDSDICLLIGRERAEKETDYSIETKFFIKKNRNGAVGTVKAFFLPHTVNFIEIKG